MERISSASAKDFRKGISGNGFGEPDGFVDGNIERYFKEISQIDLLTVEKERELGARIISGRLAAISLYVINKNSLPNYAADLICEELETKGAQRLLSYLKPSQYPDLEKLNRERLEGKIKRSKGAVNFQDKLAGYAMSLNEQIESASNIQDIRLRALVLTGVIGSQVALIRDGADAFKTMQESNLRLVVSVAKKFRGRGMSLMDMVQEGSLGLTRAIEKFDPITGYKVSTYAVWWIRQAIQRSLCDKVRHVRLPTHVHEKISIVEQIREYLAKNGVQEPTDGQILKEAKRRGARISAGELRWIILGWDLLSLDMPIGEEEDSTIADMLECGGLYTDQEAILNELRERVREAINRLPDRERRILELRYGLVDGRDRTLDAVGDAFGLTRERVRQIESKAIIALRTNGDLDQYREHDPKAIPQTPGQILGLSVNSKRASA